MFSGSVGSISGHALSSPSSFLTLFYDFPGYFVDGVNQVLVIKEGGVSILAVVIVVVMILLVFSSFSTNHN